MAVSVARPEDRVAAAIAFEEAVMAAVVEDLVDEETVETLRCTSDDLVSLTGLPSPGRCRPSAHRPSSRVAVFSS